jgi:hypothetical protein
MNAVTTAASSDFHILRAAPVEVAVFFHELERVGGPVFAARFHHVEMADDQDRLVRAAAVQARHQVPLALVGAENLGVGRREPGVEQALAHGLGGNSGAADRIGGVDFNQLLKDVVGEAAGGIVKLRAGRKRQKHQRGARKRGPHSCVPCPHLPMFADPH